MGKQKEKNYFFDVEVLVPYEKKEIKTFRVKANDSETATKKVQNEVALTYNGSCFGVNKKTSPKVGIIFLGIAVFLSMFNYYSGFNSINLFPNVQALVFSLLIYSSFVIRVKGLKNTFKNGLDTIISILFIFVLGSFIKVFARDSVDTTGIISSILKKIGFGNNYLLILAAVVVSWIGMRQVSGFIWVAVILLGTVELFTMGDYMGTFKSVLFIMSAFIGFIFYLKYEGAVIVNSFKNMASTTNSYISGNIKQSMDYAKDSINSIKNNSQSKIGENNE